MGVGVKYYGNQMGEKGSGGVQKECMYQQGTLIGNVETTEMHDIFSSKNVYSTKYLKIYTINLGLSFPYREKRKHVSGLLQKDWDIAENTLLLFDILCQPDTGVREI